MKDRSGTTVRGMLAGAVLVGAAVLVAGCSSTSTPTGAATVRTTSTDPSRAAIDRANDDFSGCTVLVDDWGKFKSAHLDGLAAGYASMAPSDWAALAASFQEERGKITSQLATMHDATTVDAWRSYTVDSESVESTIRSGSTSAAFQSMTSAVRQATAGIDACTTVIGGGY